MPTTATVAPRRIYTAADIASGLRAVADLIEGKPWIAAGVRAPGVPQNLNLGLTERSDVEALATIFDAEVIESGDGQQTYFSTVGLFDGLQVSAYSIVDHPRVLRRDPEATAHLAGRDA